MDIRLNDLEAQVTAIEGATQSTITLLNGIAAELRKIAPNQAQIDAFAARIQTKANALATAVAANSDLDDDPNTNPPGDPTPTDPVDDDT